MNPIAVIAFNRPDYLALTLASLAMQLDVQIGPIALFQDGMENPYSSKRYGEDALIDEQIAFFRRLFPRGQVFRAKHNLVPPLMVERAEDWVFEQCDADVGYFFEDDMVLMPYYSRSLENLLAATENDERVGYCACYGPLQPAPPAPANSYVRMHMNWAFALRRRQWLKSKPYVDAYLDLLRDCDYRDRPMGKIMALRESWGAPGVYTTQDVIKTVALRLTGGIKVIRIAAMPRNTANWRYETPAVQKPRSVLDRARAAPASEAAVPPAAAVDDETRDLPHAGRCSRLTTMLNALEALEVHPGLPRHETAVRRCAASTHVV